MYNTDLSWLPNHLLKDITLPKIEFVPNSGEYSGYYQHNSNTLFIVEGIENIESTIAHEFKHYLQEKDGYLTKKPLNWAILENALGYESSINYYFTHDYCEYEALLFEYKYAKCYYNDWWLRKLVWKK